MNMAILQPSMSLPKPSHSLASAHSISSTQNHTLSLLPKFSTLTLHTHKSSVIRMGGGPRTYPGGVSKWQWKRMQAKKAKQLLKARLSRERQIYEMRKRAEIKAAVSELERPWEVVEKPSSSALFSMGADEQLKVLADRFQKPGGFDLWSERDGPQLFETPDGLPTARFFPKGVVHSVKPYRKLEDDEDERQLGDGYAKEETNGGGRLKGNRKRALKSASHSDEELQTLQIRNSKFLGFSVSGDGSRVESRTSVNTRDGNRSRKYRSKQSYRMLKDGSLSDDEAIDGELSDSSNSKVFSRNQMGRRSNPSDGRKDESRRRFAPRNANDMKAPSASRQMRPNDANDIRRALQSEDVYDMRLEQDGSYSLNST